MRSRTLRSSGRFGKQALAVAFAAVALAATLAIVTFGMVRPALAATDDADAGLTAAASTPLSMSAVKVAKPTKASAFEYKVGRYVVDGKVQTSKFWQGTRKIGNTKYTRTKSKYGPEFNVSTITSGGGGGAGYAAAGGGYGYDCGAGVYITGFKGSKNAKVVVPNEIGGKPVVCICLMGAKMKSLDVSQCQSLKALSLGYPPAGGTDCAIGEIKFGKNAKLVHFNLDRSTVTRKLDITPKNIRVLRLMYSNPKNGFSFSAPKLRSFGCYNITGLSLGASSNLKELSVPACGNCKLNLAGMPQLVSLDVSGCGLSKLNVSKNKKLKTLYASGNNFGKKKVAALKKWEKAKKGRKLYL